jgi:hypothetical protein
VGKSLATSSLRTGPTRTRRFFRSVEISLALSGRLMETKIKKYKVFNHLNDNYHAMSGSKGVLVFRRSPRLKWPKPLFHNGRRRDLPLAGSEFTEHSVSLGDDH